MVEVLEIGDIKNRLIAFDPGQYKHDLTDTLVVYRQVEQKLKEERAKKFLTFKNTGEKTTDGLVKEMVEADKSVQKLEGELIQAEGKYISAKMAREDYFEINADIKKLAEIVMLELQKFSPPEDKPIF